MVTSPFCVLGAGVIDTRKLQVLYISASVQLVLCHNSPKQQLDKAILIIYNTLCIIF